MRSLGLPSGYSGSGSFSYLQSEIGTPVFNGTWN